MPGLIPLRFSDLHQMVALPHRAKCITMHLSFASRPVALQYVSIRSTKSKGLRSSLTTPPENVGNLKCRIPEITIGFWPAVAIILLFRCDISFCLLFCVCGSVHIQVLVITILFWLTVAIFGFATVRGSVRFQILLSCHQMLDYFSNFCDPAPDPK